MGLLRVCLTVTTVVLAQRMCRWGSTLRLFWRQTSRAASTTANSSWSGDELKPGERWKQRLLATR